LADQIKYTIRGRQLIMGLHLLDLKQYQEKYLVYFFIIIYRTVR